MKPPELKLGRQLADDTPASGHIPELASDAMPSLAAAPCAASVWRFDEAPKPLQELSTNGGDEDWLVELPPGWEKYGTPLWIEVMAFDGELLHYPHPDNPGWKVIIGAHA